MTPSRSIPRFVCHVLCLIDQEGYTKKELRVQPDAAPCNT